MAEAAVAEQRVRRRALAHAAVRSTIMVAARNVAARDGAKYLSLRSVAAEAGFAPAALYGYFRNKDELLLALAAEDLGALGRSVRDAGVPGNGEKLVPAAAAALSILCQSETLAAAASAFAPNTAPSEATRLFNGRLIFVLKSLSEASGKHAQDRLAQCDVVLLASAIAGLALLVRTGRLSALGFSEAEVLAGLQRHFAR